MFFKTICLYTIGGISSFLVVAYFFGGVHITQEFYYILIPLLLALVNYFIDPVIKFFTLKIRFLTIWLFMLLFCIPVLYFLTAFAQGINFKAGVFRNINFGVFQVSSFAMSDIVTILASAFVLGFGAAMIRWLVNKAE